MTQFKWTSKRKEAALSLASGYTELETAVQVNVSRSSISRWKRNLEFAAEVDRLSLMVDIASRAERLRIAMRVARQKIDDESIDTDRDLLDWLKFAQSETDGIKLDLTRLKEVWSDDTE